MKTKTAKDVGTKLRIESFDNAVEVGDHDAELDDGDEEDPKNNPES